MASLVGGPDAILVPDPTTFRILLWAPRTGWVLSEMHLVSGEPMPLDTRQILNRQRSALDDRGYAYISGLEVEVHITSLDDPKLEAEQSGRSPDPPEVSMIAHGFQYLTEQRSDEIDPILQILYDNLEPLGLPLRTMEDE